MGERERGGRAAPASHFYCANGHSVRPAFALEAVVPDTGLPELWISAGASRTPAQRATYEPYKNPPCLREERRSDEDGAGS